jgi:MFS family permease
MYPARVRGRVVGFIGSGRAAAAALAALAGGILADRLGGTTAVALAGLVGLACALAYAGLRAPNAERPASFSARDSIRALRDRPVLSRIAVAQGFYGGGLIAAMPLYAIVNVDRLDLSLADVGIIGIMTAGATTLSFLIWGAVADRRGPLVAMRLGSALGLAALIAYALAPDVAVLWVAAIAAGAGSASIDVGIASAVSDHTPLASRAAAMAGWNAITGARGIVAAFTMSVLLQVGVVDVTTGLLLCAAVTAVGVVLYARASMAEAAPARAVYPQMSPIVKPSGNGSVGSTT